MVSVDWLKGAELFEALRESQLNALLSHSVVESFSEGKTIFKQGGEATRLYILVEGSVDLTVKAEKQIDFMTSKIEKEGAVFGTASLMEPYRYNVSAICVKPSTVLIMEADYLGRKMEEDPGMGLEIMKKLASIYFNRLNEMREGVSNLIKFFNFKKP
jgi:CRP-like cAMP-binding protein